MAIGTIAAIACDAIAHWRSNSALDDTLDVFPCHGVGGMVGMLATAVFATKAVNGAGAATVPIFQPVTWKVLPKLLTTKARAASSGWALALACGSPS